MNVVGYVSSFRMNKLDRSLELKIQRDKIEDFCSKHNFNLARIYEESFDSRDDYKPELIKLLNDAHKKDFKKVVVIKLDRFGSDSSIKSWISIELKKQNIEIFSISESQIVKSGATESESYSKVNLIKQKVRDIPSLPEVVIKVMELVQDPKSSAAQLSRVIAHDPGLTSRVLRLVNSAYYGFPKQISSIQHAIMILGFTTMRGLVLSSSIFKIFTPKTDSPINLDYKKFWRHSIITALASKQINSYLMFQEDDDLFSAAILHDIGKIILDQYDHENYVKSLFEAPIAIMSDYTIKAETKNCEITHPEIGYLIADGWNLPESLSEVIKYHHTPLESAINTKMATIVYLGNILAHMLLDEINFDIRLFEEKVLDYLGINGDDILAILPGIIEEVNCMGELESFFK